MLQTQLNYHDNTQAFCVRIFLFKENNGFSLTVPKGSLYGKSHEALTHTQTPYTTPTHTHR